MTSGCWLDASWQGADCLCLRVVDCFIFTRRNGGCDRFLLDRKSIVSFFFNGRANLILAGRCRERNMGDNKGDENEKQDDSDEEEEEFIFNVPAEHRSEGDEEQEFYVENHVLLLHMLSKYAVCASKDTDKETWIRDMPLTVLLFESITEGLIDLDYAPCSKLVTIGSHSRRIWLNISQEGKAAVDDLRENGLLNGLKMSTEDFQPITAYQVSKKGLAFLSQVPGEATRKMDAFTHKDGKLVSVCFDEDEDAFVLSTEDGSYRKVSDVTETEDVSYVSSPYLPKTMRAKTGKVRTFTSNAHRAHESATGASNIADELDEAVILGNVHCMVGEWIPFGSNQIVALNERLGAMDRCQGGLFTAMVDKSPTDTKFAVPPGLTQVTILDYDFVRFINFEAEINYPEDEGIVQVENFGMHLNVDGMIAYGIKVEAILDRQSDDISIDHLSRVLVDVHQDSSAIMNDLLSQYQRSLLDMIFLGDAEMRNKFNCIIADKITPKMPAEDYMDKGDHENELKQILGDIHACHDLGPEDVILIGRDGILIAGPNSASHEELLTNYLSLLTRDLFIRNFFVRTFILDDALKRIRRLIMDYQKDPNNIARVRSGLSGASRDIILLKEILEYLRESLEEMEVACMPKGLAGRRLFKVLDVPNMKRDVMMRCSDLDKLIEGAHHQLMTLQQMTDVINTKQLEDVFKNVDANTKYLVDASAASERSSASLEMMQVILAGGFCFDVVDRLSGGTLNIVVPNWFEEMVVVPIISVPFFFFALNLVWLFIGCSMLLKLMKYLAERSSGVLTLRVKTDRKVNMEKLLAYTAGKMINVTDSISEIDTDTTKLMWNETDAALWQGEPPVIEIMFDHRYDFLLTVFFQVSSKRNKLNETELMEVFESIMKRAGVF